jgi:membrane-bound metal-dependent hydrolase YbcI (DUF457 family)
MPNSTLGADARKSGAHRSAIALEPEMPSIISHPAVPLALALGLGPQVVSERLLLAGVAASVVPELDVVAFRLGIPYADDLGHRGFTHSLLFAAFVALAAACWRKRRMSSTGSSVRVLKRALPGFL